MKRFCLLAGLLLLTGCGKIVPLEPAPGHKLPIKPAMALTQPTADDLLRPRTDAAPARVDELMRRSLPRRMDRFDLPPPDGGSPATEGLSGAAPPPPGSASNSASADPTGTDQPR